MPTDTERIDWIEANLVKRVKKQYTLASDELPKLETIFYVEEGGWSNSVRESIDKNILESHKEILRSHQG